MNFRYPLIVGMAILFTGFAVVASYEAFGILGVIMLMLMIVLFVIGILFTFRRVVLIDETEIGVIFNRFNNSFSRFVVSPDPEPARRLQRRHRPGWVPIGRRIFIFNDPYHIRLSWFEEVQSTIPKKPQTAKGKLENVRTADGIPISISWKASYMIDIKRITPKIEHIMARVLPEYADKIVTSKVERAIKHLVELRSIRTLYEMSELQEYGALQGLEQEICQRLNRQLSQPVNFGFKELTSTDIALGPIEVPAKVEKALELAHQRKIQTEMVAQALERLQQAVSGFSNEDIRRLSELERLRILDDKEIRSLYLSDAFVHSESAQKKLNGRSHSEH